MSKIKAHLKDLHSPDIDLRDPGLAPGDPFCVLLEAAFGIEGEDGADQFNFRVCSPAWIEQEARKGVLSGRHFLIAETFDLSELEEVFSRLCDRCVGDDWADVGNKLSRYGKWEFQDYKDGAKQWGTS